MSEKLTSWLQVFLQNIIANTLTKVGLPTLLCGVGHCYKIQIYILDIAFINSCRFLFTNATHFVFRASLQQFIDLFEFVPYILAKRKLFVAG